MAVRRPLVGAAVALLSLVLALGLAAVLEAQTTGCDVFANRAACRLFTAVPPIVYTSNRGATIEGPCEARLPHVRDLGGGASVWWVWQAPERGLAVISTFNSTFDTLLGVYAGKDLCAFDPIAHNDDEAAGVATSRVVFDADPNEDYQIVVDGKQGQTGEFALQVALYTCPEIVAQPQSRAAGEGRAVEFTVEALGARPMSFQWEYRPALGMGGFAPLPGETNAWLKLIAAAEHAGEYRVVITNAYCVVTSNPAGLEIQSAPELTAVPQPATNLACETRCFAVTATGGLPFTNRWQFRPTAEEAWRDLTVGVSFSGDSTHCIPELTTDHSGEYRVVVANAAGVTNSPPVTLQILPWIPEVQRGPADQLGFEGEGATLGIGWLGPVCEPTTFHWLYRAPNTPPGNARPYAVNGNPALELPSLQAAHAGFYSVIISNRYGASLPSREGLLTLARRPPNDRLGDRFLIPTAPAIETGSNRYATAEPGEPDHAGSPAQHSVWWAYRPPRLGVASVNLAGSSFAPRVGIYAASGVGALSNVTSGDGSAVFLAQPGVEYLIAVDGAAGAEGEITLQLELSDGSCPEWRLEPAGFEEIGDFPGGEACRTRTLRGEVVSLTPLSFQWLYQEQPVPGATNQTLELDRLTTDHTGDYRLVVQNLACAVTSRVAHVEVLVGPRIVRGPVMPATPLSLCTNDLTLDVEAEACRRPLVYQWRHQGRAIPGATNASLPIPSLDPRTAGEYDVVVSNPHDSVVSQVVVYETDAAPPLIISPTRAAHPLCSDVLLTLATGECLDVAYQWRQDGAPIPGATEPVLVLTNLAPAHVGAYDVVLSFGGTSLTSRLDQVLLETPRVRQEPNWPSHALCGAVRLTLELPDCRGAARYQWRRDGRSVPGANEPELVLDPLTPELAGRYDVVVRFGDDAITSAPADVGVAAVPAITRPPEAVTVTNCGPAQFCVEVSSSPCAPPRFQWFRGPTGSAATNLLAGATNGCFRLDSVAPGDAGTYAVEVRTPFGTNVSAPARLAVLAAPRIAFPASPSFIRVRAGDSFTNSVQAESCPARLTYAWWHDGRSFVADANHELRSNGELVVRNAGLPDSGSYTCVVDNGLERADTSPVTVRVVAPPPNDDFTNRVLLVGTDLVATTYADGTPYRNELASAEPDEPGVPGNPPARTVWWTWTASTPGRVTFDLTGSTGLSGGAFDTLLGVFQGETLDTLRLVASDDNSGDDGRSSRVSFLAARGRTFHFAVDGKAGSEGYIALRLVEQEIISPPVIEQHPASVAANPGEDAVFTVQASGSPDLLYQWLKDDAEIPGATNAVLVLSNVQTNDLGNYRVHIRNEYAPATNSLAARLTFGAIIRGQVTDATNGRPVPGATVSAGGVSAVTDFRGQYELVGVEPGHLRADFDAEAKRGDQVVVGLLDPVSLVDRSTLAAVALHCEKRPDFVDFEDNQLEPVRGRSVTNEISMSPRLTGMRFVLNWGAEPADLDLVMTARSPLGFWQVDYLWVGQGGSNAPPYVTFDVDARDGFGPETMTLHRLLPATYQLYVRKFSERARGALAASAASVRVYESDPDTGVSRLVGIREVPSEGAGSYWYLCDVDGASRVVRWQNVLANAPPAPGRTLAGEPAVAIVSAGRAHAPASALGTTLHRPTLHAAGLPGVEYTWNLGDGTSVEDPQSPTHAYTVPGCMDVQLRLVQSKPDGSTTSVTNKPCFVVVTNGYPEVAITSPVTGHLVRAGDPIQFEVQAADTDRNPGARQLASVELFRLEAGRTNWLTTWRAAPYTWTYAETGLPGAYLFVARATDLHGAASWSAPVPVEVRDLRGEILIVRGGEAAEIHALIELLHRPSIPRQRTDPGEPILDLQVPEVRVLDQAGFHFDLVRDFRLIIWDDAGRSDEGLQPNTVAVLLEAWQQGIPLYLIGQHLASAVTRFTGAEATKATVTWQELCRLAPAEGTAEACAVTLLPPESLFNELFRSSWHGDVLPFVVPGPVERAVVLAEPDRFPSCDPTEPLLACLGEAQTRLACGEVPLLVRTPRIGQESALRPLRLSQNFLVSGGEDDQARVQRETLFLNSVLWLLRNSCAQRGPTLELAEGGEELRVGTCENLTLQARLSHHAECVEGGVLVSMRVPDGFLVCGVQVISDPPETSPAVLQAGETMWFDFGLLRNSSHTLEVAVRACAPGSFTNRFELTSANRTPVVLEQPVLVEGAPCAACTPPALEALVTSGMIEVRARPAPACAARLEASGDLQTWQEVPDGDTPWVWRLPMVGPGDAPTRFFRLSPVR